MSDHLFEFQRVLDEELLIGRENMKNHLMKRRIEKKIRDRFVRGILIDIEDEGEGDSSFLMGSSSFTESIARSLMLGGGTGGNKDSDVMLNDDYTTYEVKSCAGVLRKKCKNCGNHYCRLVKTCRFCNTDGSNYRSSDGASFQSIPDRESDDGILLMAPTKINVEYGNMFHSLVPGNGRLLNAARDIEVKFDIWTIDTDDEFFQKVIKHEEGSRIDLSFRRPEFWGCGPVELAEILISINGISHESNIYGVDFEYDHASIDFLSFTPFNTNKRGIRFDAEKDPRDWAAENLPDPKTHPGWGKKNNSTYYTNVKYTHADTPHVLELAFREVEEGTIDKDDLFIDREESQAYQQKLDELTE